MKLTDIQLNPNNPRFIKDDKFKKLCQSIKEDPEFLNARPIVVKDGIIYGGNMRFRALQELGIEIKPEWIKDVSDWTAEQIRKFVVIDNIAYGDNDWDMLSEQYEKEELENWGMDVDKWAEDEVVEDKVPEVTDNPVSKLGEVYQLGRHRIMCGDSTKIEDVEKLMDGKKADMVFTDPPYGIAHSGKGITGKIKGNDFGEIVGDGDIKIAVDAYKLCKTLEIDNQVWWGANYYCSHLNDGHGWIVWDKEKEGDLFSGFEIAYSTMGIKSKIYRHKWHGMIRASEQGQKTLHPTQKPIKLCVDILNDFDKQIILDLFLGSGSTIIACEQTNRICYGMEIDPKYIDVIRKRYAKFIGKEEEWETITPVLK